MTDTPTPAPAPEPEEDKIPLLRVLEDLGSTLVSSELPGSSQALHVLGAIVKVMDHGGVEVADELWPAEPTPVTRPETVDALHRAKTDDRLSRIETMLERLFDHQAQAAPAPGPAAPAPATPEPPAAAAPVPPVDEESLYRRLLEHFEGARTAAAPVSEPAPAPEPEPEPAPAPDDEHQEEGQS